jgi:hypothetical protein
VYIESKSTIYEVSAIGSITPPRAPSLGLFTRPGASLAYYLKKLEQLRMCIDSTVLCLHTCAVVACNGGQRMTSKRASIYRAAELVTVRCCVEVLVRCSIDEAFQELCVLVG